MRVLTMQLTTLGHVPFGQVRFAPKVLPITPAHAELWRCKPPNASCVWWARMELHSAIGDERNMCGAQSLAEPMVATRAHPRSLPSPGIDRGSNDFHLFVAQRNHRLVEKQQILRGCGERGEGNERFLARGETAARSASGPLVHPQPCQQPHCPIIVDRAAPNPYEKLEGSLIIEFGGAVDDGLIEYPDLQPPPCAPPPSPQPEGARKAREQRRLAAGVGAEEEEA
ncbi:MAG: hypothetical protein SGPRY_009215, partial [Prymnesium sp.]